LSTVFKPHEYQQVSINHILDNPRCALFLEMGLGKTVATLTALQHLMREEFCVHKVLIIAPLRVARKTWTDEIDKWGHLDLTVSKMIGNKEDRAAAYFAHADLYIINRENVVWLVDFCGGSWPFDTVVIDELSSFKSNKAGRFKKLRKSIRASSRVIGLTGTPAPNGLIDLWPQMYLLDNGERLGKTVTAYREDYFTPDRKCKDAKGRLITLSYKDRVNTESVIYNRIGDICLSMKAADHLTMPERIVNYVNVDFTPPVRKAYEDFERDQYMEFLSAEGDSEEAVALSAAALVGKLLQFSNGAMYTTAPLDLEYTPSAARYVEVSDAKLDALEDLIEAANGKPLLVFYSFKHDLDRIKKRFGNKVQKFGTDEDQDNWNAGNIEVLLAHPASAGHGLNLQHGGSTVVWFGLTWSLELYEQANARLWRQGQKDTVVLHHIVTNDTADQRVLAALTCKEEVQSALMDALKRKYKTVVDSSPIL